MGAFPSYRLLVVLIMIFLSDVGPAMSCLESERQALLAFKGGLIDESNRLGSWVDVGGGSCCDWYGVSCNNSMGHVTGLHLQLYGYDPELSYEAYRRTQLRGTISPSLIYLKQLVHLNLSLNDFGGTGIPPFLGQMTSLKQLDLSNAGFGGRIPSQIGNLTNMDYLVLSGYGLSSESLQWVSSLSLLHHLDLSGADLSKAGDWFHSINAIPSLSELILSECELDHFPFVPLLNNLSSLAILDLSNNQFEQPSSIPKWIFHLHNLNALDFYDCNFQEGPIPDGLQNLSSLRSLDLSFNNFNSSIPSWLYGFSSGLEILHLEYNRLQGVISSAIGNLTSLSDLELEVNSDLEIGGRETIKSLGQLCRLKYLGLRWVKVNHNVVDIFRDLFSSSCPSNGLEAIDLDSAGIFGKLSEVSFQMFKSLFSLNLQNNSISGSIPPSFGELRSLETAYLNGNSMVGSVSETHFAKLVGLKYFSAGGNKLELKVSPNWIPPFQLLELYLSSWQLGKEFPPWLHSQKNIQRLYLSGCGIEGSIPKWLGNMSSQLEYLDLANNQLKGEVPVIFSSKLEKLDLSNNSIESISKGFWNFSGTLSNLNLSHNQIVGEIPRGNFMMLSGGDNFVDLSSNKFHGLLPPFSSNLGALDVSGNSFSGSLSHFLCYQMNVTKQMQALNLGNNSLSGEIPNCWLPWKQLSGLKLNNNNFNGRISSSMQNLSLLESLHLRNNNLSGGLPLLLRSSQRLITVDLAENHFQGEIPSWIGKTNMKILSLRSNKLEGKVPHEICALSSLQILDLANNNLSGEVPECINNFTAMINGFSDTGVVYDGYQDNAILVIKGRVMEYTTTLNLVRIVDFSDNFFTGEIPNEVTDLAALQSLNLSHNILTGEIPQNIGAMTSLESLDLSGNKLVGEIPSSISSLNFLNHLNLSSNNLTGPIPSSTQLQSFDASCFADNDHLCGPPLANECDEKHTFPVSGDADGEGMSTYLDMEGFFVSMAFGFVFGFWLFMLPLFCIRQWRMAFFSFLDSVGIFICKFLPI